MGATIWMNNITLYQAEPSSVNPVLTPSECLCIQLSHTVSHCHLMANISAVHERAVLGVEQSVGWNEAAGFHHQNGFHLIRFSIEVKSTSFDTYSALQHTWIQMRTLSHAENINYGVIPW